MSVKLRSRFEWRSILWAMLRSSLRRYLDPLVGAVIRGIIAAAAWLAEEHDIQVFRLLQSVWQPAGDDLDLAVADLPMSGRKAATKATVAVVFELSPGLVSAITIPAETRVQASRTGIVAKSKASATALGTTTIECEAENAGAAGNVAPGDIDRLLSPIEGVLSVSNAESGMGGSDEEADVALRTRRSEFYDSLRGGTPTALEAAAKAVAGVAFAGCREHYPAPGECTLAICDGDGNATDEMLEAVELALEEGGAETVPGYRAAGGVVHVERPQRFLLVPSLLVQMKSGQRLDDHAAAIELAVQERVGVCGLAALLTLSQLGDAVEDAVPEVFQVSAVTALLVGMPIVLPITAHSTEGTWQQEAFEFAYSALSVRWGGSDWVSIDTTSGLFVNPVTFRKPDGSASLTAYVTPWTENGRWPRYSLVELVSRLTMAEVTQFEPNVIPIAGSVTVVAAPISGTLVPAEEN